MKKSTYLIVSVLILFLSACGENIPALPGTKIIIPPKVIEKQVEEKPSMVLTDLPKGWTQILVDTNNSFRDFYFLNEKTGWLITSAERICKVYKTKNGGSSWINDSVLSNKFPGQITQTEDLILPDKNSVTYLSVASLEGFILPKILE